MYDTVFDTVCDTVHDHRMLRQTGMEGNAMLHNDTIHACGGVCAGQTLPGPVLHGLQHGK